MFIFVLIVAFISIASARSAPGNQEFGDLKFVGGRLVDISEFPYQVGIYDQDGFWCGGSILSPYHVLTAGRCAIIGRPPLNVRAGSSYFSEGGSVHLVGRNVTYDNLTQYDVAILYLNEPITFDEKRQPIELVPAGDQPEPGLLGVLTGWGVKNPRLPVQLRAMDIPIVDRSACSQLYNGTDIGQISEGQICAGYFDTRQENICNGESGAPLAIGGRQVGILSLGQGCTLKYNPGVYADISFYSDWIKKQMAVDS